MSGIFIVVWDEKQQDKSDVLRTTVGGYPHMTLAYTGTHLSRDFLVGTARDVLAEWAGRTLTLTEAYANSFEKEPGVMRHDVLMRVQQTEAVEMSRLNHLRKHYGNADKFSMNEPHVTHGTGYASREEAERVAAQINRLLPYDVLVIGVTIN